MARFLHENDFDEFDLPEEVEFFSNRDWIIDYGEYKNMSDEEFSSAAEKFFGELDENLSSKKVYLSSLLKTRVAKFREIPAMIKFLMEMPPFDAELFVNKRNKVTVEKSVEIIKPALEMLEKVDDWTLDTLNEKISAFTENSGLKTGTVMWPLRIAISGQKVTPGGVVEILYLLGREEGLKRLSDALNALSK